MVKNLPAKAGDIRDCSWISGSGRYSGKEYDNPLQYTCLKNLMDRGAWQATLQRVAESGTTEAPLHAQYIKIDMNSSDIILNTSLVPTAQLWGTVISSIC